MKRLLILSLLSSVFLYAAEPEPVSRVKEVDRSDQGVDRAVDEREEVGADAQVSQVGLSEGQTSVEVASSVSVEDHEKQESLASGDGLAVHDDVDEYQKAHDQLYERQVQEFSKSPVNMIFARAASWSIGSARQVIGAKAEDLNGMRFPILADKPFVGQGLQDAYGALLDAFNVFETASKADYDDVGGRIAARHNVELVMEARIKMMEEYGSVLDVVLKSAEGLDGSSRDFVKQVKKWIKNGQYYEATTASPELLKILAASGSKGGSLVLSQMMMMDVTLGRAVGELNAKVAPSESSVEQQVAQYNSTNSKHMYKLFQEKGGQVSVYEMGQVDDLEDLLVAVEADKLLVEKTRRFGRSASGKSDSMYNALLRGTQSFVDIASDDLNRADYQQVKSHRELLEHARADMLQEYASALKYLAGKSGNSSEFKSYAKTVGHLIAQGRYLEIADYESSVVDRMLANSSSKKAALIVAQMRSVSKSMDYAIDDLLSIERSIRPVSQKEQIDRAIADRDHHLYDDRAQPPPSPAGGYASRQAQPGDVKIVTDQFML